MVEKVVGYTVVQVVGLVGRGKDHLVKHLMVHLDSALVDRQSLASQGKAHKK
jgi:hypothetical protein